MPDPETIVLIQSFGNSIAQNLIASAVVEWKKLKDDGRAQVNAAWFENVEHSKTFETRIAQKVSQAFHQLSLSREQINLLLPLATDAILNSELTKQIISNEYSVDSVARLVLAHQPHANVGEAQAKLLGSHLIEAIQSAIAEDPHLCRVEQLRYQTRTTEAFSDLHKELASGFAKNQAGLSQLPGNLEAMVRNVVKSAMAEGTQGAEHSKSQYQKQFDRAREELLNGSIVVAERDYRALVEDLENLGSNADTKLLFRSYTNLASSLWQQFRRDEAVLWFDKAYATKPDESKAKTNKAAGHIHRREFQAALAILNELRTTSPDCFEAHYLVSCIHLEQNDVGRAVAVLEGHGFENDSYFEALAEAYLRREEYSKAVEAARRALALNSESKEALVTLANCLGFPLVRRRMRLEVTAFSLTEAERQQILEAIRIGESAVKTLRAQARSFQLGEMLTNLSAFYDLAGDDEAGAEAAKEAAAFAPQSVITLTNYWAAQMRLGKHADAYFTAGKLIHIGEKIAGKLRQLESLLLSSEHERLLQESAKDTELISGLLKQPRYFELKARAQFELHQTDAAFATIKEGLTHFPDDPRLYCARALLYEDLEQLDAARKDLDHAEQTAAGDGARTLLQGAMFHYHQSDWSAAEQRFAKLGAESIHSPFLDSYLVCLHNLGQFLQCFALATKAIAANPTFNPTLHELAARCAYNANDLPSAQKHFEKLVHHNTVKVAEHQKMLAQVYLRLDEPEKAFAVLKKAHTRKPKDVEVLIALSFVSTIKRQHKEAVEYAFVAVHVAGKNPQAHMALVKAALDCPPDFKVDEKHGRAFQRSLEFLNKHPSGVVKAIPFDEDLKSFIAMAKARADQAHRIEELIRDRHLPMSILPQQLGVSPFQAWLGLIGHPTLHIHMANGTAEEQARACHALLSKRARSMSETKASQW